MLKIIERINAINTNNICGITKIFQGVHPTPMNDAAEKIPKIDPIRAGLNDLLVGSKIRCQYRTNIKNDAPVSVNVTAKSIAEAKLATPVNV